MNLAVHMEIPPIPVVYLNRPWRLTDVTRDADTDVEEDDIAGERIPCIKAIFIAKFAKLCSRDNFANFATNRPPPEGAEYFEFRYLWSPKRNSKGARSPFYESMREVSPGDLIFSFVDTRIHAIGMRSGAKAFSKATVSVDLPKTLSMSASCPPLGRRAASPRALTETIPDVTGGKVRL